MFVGDYIGNFHAGALVLTGPNLPHNWVSDIARGQEVKDRDMLIQFGDGLLRDMMRICPELEEIEPLLDEARLGIEFLGAAARLGARLLRRIGEATATPRLIMFLELLYMLSRSPERQILSSREYAPTLNHTTSDTINRAIDFLINNLTEDIRLSDVSRYCDMSDSVFSRFFKTQHRPWFRALCQPHADQPGLHAAHQDRNAGDRHLLRNRVQQHLQLQPPVPGVCGLTPSEYRREGKRNIEVGRPLFLAAPRFRDRAEPGPATDCILNPGSARRHRSRMQNQIERDIIHAF